MLKKISPGQLAGLVSVLTAISVALLAGTLGLPRWETLVLVMGSALTSGWVTQFLVRKFVLGHVQRILDAISLTKSSLTNESGVGLGSDPLAQVEEVVSLWTKEQNLKREEQEKLERYRKEFLGNVSHELKTPIFNIQGYIHTLLDGAMEDPATNLSFLQKAARSADRMEALVKDLLTISELESGTVRMEWEDFDLHELLQDVFDSVDHKARNRGITIEIKAGCQPPFVVRADRKKIRQVLVNLLSNSIHYGNDNGLTQVGVFDMGQQFLLEISDNGMGIEPEHHPRLFERFYRVDKGRSRSEGGTGLGLAIVKHMLDVHGQTIHVRSSSGVGSTFGFTLNKAQT
ncbi:MAG: sensor histidine kinase [Bacteroidota bacterium]